MADSPSTARESSPAAPHPASPTPASPPKQSTPRTSTTVAAAAPPLPTLADEYTPLLSTSTDGPAEDAAAPRPRTATTLYRLTTLSLGLSVAVIVLYIAITILTEFSRCYLGYLVRDGLMAVLITAIVAMLYSSTEIHRVRASLGPMPVLISLLFGVLIGLYSIGYSVMTLGELIDGYDRWCNHGLQGCRSGLLIIKIIAVLAACAALVLGLVQVVMVVMNCRRGFRNGFFQDSWRFPSGQLTLQFTIKLLREPERTEREERSGNDV